MRISHLLLASVLCAGASASPPAHAQPRPSKPSIALASWVELSNAAADIARLQAYVDHLQHAKGRCHEYGNRVSCSLIRGRAKQRVVEAEKHLKRLRIAARKAKDLPGLKAVQASQTLLGRVDQQLLALGLGAHGSQADRYDDIRTNLAKALELLDDAHRYTGRLDASLGARVTALGAAFEMHLPAPSLQGKPLMRARREASRIESQRAALERSSTPAVKNRLRKAKPHFVALEKAVRELGNDPDTQEREAVRDTARKLAKALL